MAEVNLSHRDYLSRQIDLLTFPNQPVANGRVEAAVEEPFSGLMREFVVELCREVSCKKRIWVPLTLGVGIGMYCHPIPVAISTVTVAVALTGLYFLKDICHS